MLVTSKVQDAGNSWSHIIFLTIGCNNNDYFTFPLAERTGNTGKVYANEIAQRFLDEIQSRAQREKINNIVTVLGDTEDPLFPQKNLDMIYLRRAGP